LTRNIADRRVVKVLCGVYAFLFYTAYRDVVCLRDFRLDLIFKAVEQLIFNRANNLAVNYFNRALNALFNGSFDACLV